MEELEQRASDFARRAHAGQEYGGGDFHENHLARVVANLRNYGVTDPVLLAAAWLHDTVEDTATSVEDIRREFGDDVADLVWRLTDEPGKNRKERHHLTHVKIRGRPEAVRIKLADRIANVESSIEQNTHLRGMYRHEHAAFRQDLFRENEWADMWAHLDQLMGGAMSNHVYKVIELAGSSHIGVEDAIRNAIARASRTVRNMRWFEVIETRGHVEGEKIAHWQVTLKIGFTLDDE
jgi:flavin-binding protein dodecin